MKLILDADFLEDLTHWVSTEPRTAARILKLVEEIRRNPFQGTGKPEPLKYLGPGVWSRRINQTDRLVYVVETGCIRLLQCRYHY
jgi:toxin YoeB